MSTRRIRIAVDGPASSGKGTVARLVARSLGYAYVDTGAFYRAVGLACLRAGLSTEDDDACGALARSVVLDVLPSDAGQRILLDGEDVSEAIRTPEVGMAASDVAALPQVRGALLAQQRRMGAAGGVVMDGRDIGTVVMPDAELKVFLDASLQVRAERRHLELARRGTPQDFEAVRDELRIRDEQDRHRAVAPLRQHPDAMYVDSTDKTAEQAAAEVVAEARRLGA